MKQIIAGALGAVFIGAAAGAGFIQAGGIDVAADTPHAPITLQLLEWARDRSIDRQTHEIVPPADLADAARIRRGAGNYDAMCVGCHLSPGAGDNELRKGLYPQPPDLSLASSSTDARRFWIIKHGIKASGMPAWRKGGMEDEAIWDITAFLKAMPTLSAEAYRQQVAASDGHSHQGSHPPQSATEPTRRKNDKPPAHDHAGHKH